jgi:hypothetical protein
MAAQHSSITKAHFNNSQRTLMFLFLFFGLQLSFLQSLNFTVNYYFIKYLAFYQVPKVSSSHIDNVRLNPVKRQQKTNLLKWTRRLILSKCHLMGWATL